jgi:hypothetical protein
VADILGVGKTTHRITDIKFSLLRQHFELLNAKAAGTQNYNYLKRIINPEAADERRKLYILITTSRVKKAINLSEEVGNP